MHQVLDNRQTQTSSPELAAPRFVDTIKPLKDPRKVGTWDPDPRVGDRNRLAALVDFDRNFEIGLLDGQSASVPENPDFVQSVGRIRNEFADKNVFV